MITPAQVATTFYQAFQQRDAEGMVQCYAPQVVFSDPVFPSLVGRDAGDMWRMLCKNGKDLRIEFAVLPETDDPQVVRVRWDAYYTFSKTNRQVHNAIVATMTVRDGVIVRHRDDFSFWRWARQALGPLGLVMGWFPPLQKTVRRNAQKSLAAFQT